MALWNIGLHKHLRGGAVYVLIHHMLWKKQSEVYKRREGTIYSPCLQVDGTRSCGLSLQLTLQVKEQIR